tara:strand:+ start:340 stop:630 length:291 start_codon:yes stop_codon:yes gene_type:complete
MIKLTEVVQSAGNYNSETKKVDSTYSVREFFVNPKFVVSMIENNSLSEIHKRTPIINELSPKAKFTKLTIASGVNGVVYHNVLGAPHQHMSDMLEK